MSKITDYTDGGAVQSGDYFIVARSPYSAGTNRKIAAENIALLPASSVDNTVPRFDGTTGKVIQTSNIIIGDDDSLINVSSLVAQSAKLTTLSTGVIKADSSGLLSSGATTSDVPEGSNLYYTGARFNTAFSSKTTTDLAEGSNFYFTNARARSALSNTSPITYNSTTGAIGLDQTAITITESQVTNLTTDLAAKLNLSGGTMTGNLILNSVTPTQDYQAAPKVYIDSVAAGLQVKASVAVASTANIAGTYNNGSSGVGATFTFTATGAQTLDGYSPQLNDRVLLWKQTSALQNGIYTVTTVGSTGVSMVLTRATDFDNSPAGEVQAGDWTTVLNGTLYGGANLFLSTTGTITIGTTALNFSLSNTVANLVTTGGITKSGNQISLDTTYSPTFAGMTLTGFTGVVKATAGVLSASAITNADLSPGSFTNITGVGTLSAGTWSATVIAGQYGGTGVANTGLTINLGSGGTNKVLISDSSGNASWGNLSSFGVSSISGTANQISASASIGAVTLSLPNGISLGSFQSTAPPTGGMIVPGQVGIGTSSPGSYFVNISPPSPSNIPYAAIIGGALVADDGFNEQFGLAVSPNFTPNQNNTTNFFNLIMQPAVTLHVNSSQYSGIYHASTINTSASNFNLTNFYGLRMLNPSKTGSGVISNAYNGYFILPTIATNNTALYSDNLSVGYTGLNLAAGVSVHSGNAAFGSSTVNPTSVQNVRLYIAGGSLSIDLGYQLNLRADRPTEASSGVWFGAPSSGTFNGHIAYNNSSDAGTPRAMAFTTSSNDAITGTLTSGMSVWPVKGAVSIGTGYGTTRGPDNSLIIQSRLGVGITGPSTVAHFFDSSTAPNGELGTVLISGTTTSFPSIPRLCMGINYTASTMNYAWIQSVENGALSRPLVLQGVGSGVVVGSTTLDSSAVLSVVSSSKGFLPPINTNAPSNISSPATGLMVYDSFYTSPQFYDGSYWIRTGGYCLLSALSYGSVASIAFTTSSQMPLSRFNTLLVVFENLVPTSSGAVFQLTVSIDNGSSYLSTNYSGGMNSANFASSATWSNANATSYVYCGALSSLAPAWGYVHIGNMSYAQPSFVGQMSQLGTMGLINCNQSSSGINAFKVQFSTGNISSVRILIYGLLQS